MQPGCELCTVMLAVPLLGAEGGLPSSETVSGPGWAPSGTPPCLYSQLTSYKAEVTLFVTYPHAVSRWN